jgi:hypothetical protein
MAVQASLVGADNGHVLLGVREAAIAQAYPNQATGSKRISVLPVPCGAVKPEAHALFSSGSRRVAADRHNRALRKKPIKCRLYR